jgi:regulator of protease activity HflC (stomatin/prohibitin superfamily)
LDSNSSSLIIIIVLVLIVFYVIIRTFRITRPYEKLVIQRLGQYGGTRGPGIVVVLPLLEQATYVDMRERFLEIPRQTSISKDNAPINVDFLVYYRVVDPKLSVLEIDNPVRASVNIAATTLRAVIGDISLDDVLAKRETINDTLRVKLDDVTERWGLKVTRVEIREIEPPKDVQDAMNRQMTAERERRATVTRAEGERQASIMVAEGEKQAAVLRAEGQKQSAILEAEGQRQAQLLKAQGFAAGLEALYKTAQEVDPNTMSLQYLDMLRQVGSSPSTKFVIPLELTGLVQQLGATLTGNGAAKSRSSGDGNASGD